MSDYSNLVAAWHETAQYHEWKKSMIESNGCVHDIEHYSEDGNMWLVCKKCDKSWVV